MHGHLTHDLPVVAHLFGASAFESHGRELLGVEEVRILQVSIKGFVPRVHTFDLDAHIKGWASLGIPVDGALEFIEAAIEVARAQMLHSENCGGMHTVNVEGFFGGNV